MTVAITVTGSSELGWVSPTNVGSLSVSPKFEVDGVEFELTRIDTLVGDLNLWLAGSGFGQAGVGGKAEARRWVLYLDGEEFRFDAANLGTATVSWDNRAPSWWIGKRVALRLVRLPRPDPVLNSDGSETLWEAMVGVVKQQAAVGDDIGYLRSSARGSADPGEFDWEGATYEVQQFDWVKIGSSWSLVFEIDGTRRLSAGQVNRLQAGAYFEVVNPPDTAPYVLRGGGFTISGNVATFGIDVDAPTHSDGDDLDVKLILRHVPTGAARGVGRGGRVDGDDPLDPPAPRRRRGCSRLLRPALGRRRRHLDSYPRDRRAHDHGHRLGRAGGAAPAVPGECRQPDRL